MKISSRKFQLLAVGAALTAGFAAPAQATLDLSGASYVTYGDANSYALQVDGTIAGSTGPGSPYYVSSTPGAIKDLIVVATGASGGPVNTNLPGMDNALSTPNGSGGSNFFSGIWNSTLAAFTGFLGANNPLFFFNNNQVNSGASTNQNVAVWAQISLTGAGQTTKYFDFTNRDGPYALFTEGGGGVFMGDVGAYTSTGAGPIAGTNGATDYVLSGGAICLNGVIPVSCSSPHTAGPINNNLGANQAAYAIDAPELNAFLTSWSNGLFSGYTDIHVDLRFGCDPATVGTNGGTAGVGACIGRDANNGYEQLFIGTSTTVAQVPEPGILSLLALGLLGLAVTSRRRKV
ncbi:PEP-CTERM sorting domain-containing protein [Rhodoferax sediminis]|nr:PEP-CTERM sorting domain-containing protein [Rhodoferax sediminis]